MRTRWGWVLMSGGGSSPGGETRTPKTRPIGVPLGRIGGLGAIEPGGPVVVRVGTRNLALGRFGTANLAAEAAVDRPAVVGPLCFSG